MTVAMTRVEVPDYDLGLRGKLVRAEKVTAGESLAFCTIIHGLSLADDVADTPTSGKANGYPDAPLVPDESTRVSIPWLTGDIDAVIADLIDSDRNPVATSPRGQVQRLEQRYADLGLSPTLGFEYEVWLLDTQTRQPLGRTENAYSLTRLSENHALATDFIERMELIGAPVEAFHSELGPGFFEFALKPQPALRAADGAARAKQFFRELCAERGITASFMAKPYAGKSGAGGHVHSSLARDGQNVFADAPHQLSEHGRAYVAGLLATAGDFTALFNPFINSYKRLDRDMYVAETASWGTDDRSVALRALLDSVSGARVEHRRPGADASPYLVTTALLAGGLIGIENNLELPAAGQTGDKLRSLPSDLLGAVTRFEESPHAKELLGESFVQGFAATRHAELRQYDQWLSTTITDWELRRYWEHL